MYIQKRKTLEDRINQLVHKMIQVPEDEYAARLHLRKEKGESEELPADKIRTKRMNVRMAAHHNRPRTDSEFELIALYEQLIDLEVAEQEEKDKACYKRGRLKYNLNLESLLKTQDGYINALISEKENADSNDEFDKLERIDYFTPELLRRTEDHIALYNRGVEESRDELKKIAKRYSSYVLQGWEQEFLHELEEERRQLRMTLN